ncbi:MFS general substrate transporter [Phellopilus nigrolimitatus]|nr:MFS general substrate transporter [Phellopilus nigrolimitatus]
MSVQEKAASLIDSETSGDNFDSEEDRKLLRKVDWRQVQLLPVLTLLYLLSFLDRYVDSVEICRDLHVSGANYNVSLAIYFVAYVLFEVPSNVRIFLLSHLTYYIRLKRFDPQYWLPFITLLWGIVSVCQGLVKNQAGLFGIRFLLGITEAGLFPGVIYVFSVYYRRRERHWRVAVFFGGAALAGAFGGVLAYAIGLMDGVGGRRGWEWIFILEGTLTAVVSLIAFFIVPTWSHKAKFLTEPERARLLARLAADSDAGKDEAFEWQHVRQALTDHLVWAYALLFHGYAFVLYSLSLFLPTIIAGLGFQAWQAQLMTVPPYAVAAFSIWGAAYLAAKYERRAVFIIAGGFIAIIGYVILIASKTAGGQYVGVHFATAGVYTGNALLLSWPSENVSGQTKRAVAVALQITIGDIGAVVGVLIYRPSFSGHRFRKPHIIAIGYVCFAIVVAAYLWWAMARENQRRDRLVGHGGGKEEGGDTTEDSEEERIRQGDRHIRYRYQI